MEYQTQRLINTRGGHVAACKQAELRAEELKADEKLINTSGKYYTRKQYTIPLKSEKISLSIRGLTALEAQTISFLTRLGISDPYHVKREPYPILLGSGLIYTPDFITQSTDRRYFIECHIGQADNIDKYCGQALKGIDNPKTRTHIHMMMQEILARNDENIDGIEKCKMVMTAKKEQIPGLIFSPNGLFCKVTKDERGQWKFYPKTETFLTYNKEIGFDFKVFHEINADDKILYSGDGSMSRAMVRPDYSNNLYGEAPGLAYYYYQDMWIDLGEFHKTVPHFDELREQIRCWADEKRKEKMDREKVFYK
jgi:hypothetical protein